MPLPIVAAGIMSGSSLDGLDLVLVRFEASNDVWTFDLLAAETVAYTADWKERLSKAWSGTAAELAALDHDFGAFTAAQLNRFISEQKSVPDIIGSHGHTVFHQPDQGFTTQIGNGAVIASLTGIDTVSDFRSGDVALGGQGAPLVPVGDHYLFAGHRFCLNLGGFSNISYLKKDKRIAFDICPVNIALNYLALMAGAPYDENGTLSVSGNVEMGLLKALNHLDYYKTPPPKSLGREWFEKEFRPLIDNPAISVEDRMRTVIEHIGMQVSNALFDAPGTTLFTTGGGSYNPMLTEVLEEHVSRHGIHVIIPDDEIVSFKEAIIFAFLAVLRSQHQRNILASVTGASRNSIGGALYKGV